jgi:hypothetical protein
MNLSRGDLRKALARARARIGHISGGPRVPGEKLPHGLERYGLPGRQVFFGYYDVTPFDATSERILAISAPNHNRTPRAGEEAEVGYFTRATPRRFRKLGATSAWCWQQGCRLQWFPRTEGGRNNQVIYNIATPSGFGSVIRDSEHGTELIRFDRALYDIASDGSYGLTLDFNRLGIYRPGYGYSSALPDPTIRDPAPAGSTIARVDLVTGKFDDLISLADVAAMDPEQSMAGAIHYLNHISISPDGARFLFYHFWHAGTLRYSRVCLADADGGNLRVLDLGKNASHFAWIDGQTLLFFCDVFDGGRRYSVFGLDGGAILSIEDPQMRSDGHPSVLSDGLILTDTYPDSAGYHSLLLHERSQHRTHVLARMYSPVSYSMETRCDLHPRASPDEGWISVDSARDGRRAVYVMPVERIR